MDRVRRTADRRMVNRRMDRVLHMDHVHRMDRALRKENSRRRCRKKALKSRQQKMRKFRKRKTSRLKLLQNQQPYEKRCLSCVPCTWLASFLLFYMKTLTNLFSFV